MTVVSLSPRPLSTVERQDAPRPFDDRLPSPEVIHVTLRARIVKEHCRIEIGSRA